MADYGKDCDACCGYRKDVRMTEKPMPIKPKDFSKKEEPMRTDLEFHNDLVKVKNFDVWSTPDWRNGNHLRHEIGEGTRRYTAQVVKVEEGRFSAADDSYGYYEHEGPQGWQGKAYIIFEITYKSEGEEVKLHFKKSGTVSSYYNTSWDGTWERVIPVEKTVVTYEFE